MGEATIHREWKGEKTFENGQKGVYKLSMSRIEGQKCWLVELKYEETVRMEYHMMTPLIIYHLSVILRSRSYVR